MQDQLRLGVKRVQVASKPDRYLPSIYQGNKVPFAENTQMTPTQQAHLSHLGFANSDAASHIAHMKRVQRTNMEEKA